MLNILKSDKSESFGAGKAVSPCAGAGQNGKQDIKAESGGTITNRLLRASVFYKIFLANTMLAALWTAMGIWIIERGGVLNWREPALIVLLAASAASILLSYILIHLALAPLEELTSFMTRVARGELTNRARYHPLGDPRINACVSELNRMLDTLQGEKQRSKFLVKHIINAQEEERKRIARELHDETSQVLATLVIGLEKLKLTMPDDLARCMACKGDVNRLKALTDNTLMELHKLTYNLRPSLLDDMGLEDALSWLFNEQLENEGITANFNSRGGKRLPDPIEITLFRIAQESITNIKKYARAHTVSVDFWQEPDTVNLDISDDGIGFDATVVPQDKEKHLGIFGMKERVELFGGTFKLQSSPGRGTKISVRIPTHD